MKRLSLLLVACLLVAAVAGVGAVSNGDERVLIVEDAGTGERLLTAPVSEGTRVALNYTHSVEKTPVLDVYAVEGTKLEMVRMEFHSYGAGLPSRADVNVTDNGTFVFDPEGVYDHVYVKPGRIANHHLTVGERTYDLVALSDARSVKIYVTYRSALAKAVYELTGGDGLSTNGDLSANGGLAGSADYRRVVD